MEKPQRPTGIAILAVLSIIGGILLFVMQLMHSGVLAEGMNQTLGLSKFATIANFTILSVWAVAAGIGMWKGKTWGWWLGSLYLSYSVLRNANAILTISDLSAQYADQNIDTAKYYIKHISRVIIHSLIIIYYFKNNVLTFFGLSTEKKGKRFLKFSGATLSVFVAMVIVTLV